MANTTRMPPHTALADRVPMGRHPHAVRKRIEALEGVMERLFKIPGLNKSVGLDVILDLLPFGGTTIGAAVGTYLVWEARNLGMSKWQMLRMMGNVGIDWLLGVIPWVGAIPDLLFRSNSRNMAMVKRHLDRHHPATATLDS